MLNTTEIKWLELFSIYLADLRIHLEQGSSGDFSALEALANEAFKDSDHELGASNILLGVNCLLAKDVAGARGFFDKARYAADFAVSDWVVESLSLSSLFGMALAENLSKNNDIASKLIQTAQKNIQAQPDLVKKLSWQLQAALADTAMLQKDYEKAYEKFFEATVELNKIEDDSLKLPRLAFFHGRLGTIHFLKEEYQEAKKLLTSSINLVQDQQLPLTPSFLSNVNSLAISLDKLGEKSQAEVYINWGVELIQDYYGKDNSTATDALNFAAHYYFINKDWSKAAELLNESLAWIDVVIDIEQTIWVLTKLIRINEMTNDHGQIQKYTEKLRVLYAKKYTGTYEADIALVENGDRGAAHERQQNFKRDVQLIEDLYSEQTHPQLKDGLKEIDYAVHLSPVIDTIKKYILNYLKHRANSMMEPPSERAIQLRDKLIANESSAAINKGYDKSALTSAAWSKALPNLFGQEKYNEALELLEAFRIQAENDSETDQRTLTPLLESLATAYEVTGHDLQARALKLRLEVAKLD